MNPIHLWRAGLLLGLALTALPAAAASRHPRHHEEPKAAAIPLATGATEMLSHGRFDGVAIYPPPGPVRSFVFVLSGAQGWQAREIWMAAQLNARGALVAGIDTGRLYRALEKADDECLFADGDFENLSRFIQASEKVPGYFPPILIGAGRGATLAYMLDAQGPVGTFTGAISLGFCPQSGLRRPFCGADGLRYRADAEPAGVLAASAKLSAPWTWIDTDGGGPDEGETCTSAVDPAFPDVPGARRLVSAASNRDRLYLRQYDQLAARLAVLASAPPASLGDLPLIEIPSSAPGDSFAVLLSGDGGWAGLDKDVGAALKVHGIPVVGVDSLRYFWGKRTPDVLAQDVDRIIRYYAQRWHRHRVLLIGYSQGANVLPFAYNRLPAATRAMVSVTAMMGLEARADFEFHVTNWVGSSGGLPIAPEVQKLEGGRPLCVYGVDEEDSLCPSLDPAKVKLVKLPGGHHFDGNYDHLARLVLDTAGIRPPQ